MEKLKSSFINMLLSLAVISIVSASLLAVMYGLTKEPIEIAEKQKQEKAIEFVTPEFNNSPTTEKFEIEIADGSMFNVFPAKKDDQLVGLAVESNTKKGFSGEIKIMVGFDIEGKIKNFSVLKHAETPGLGSKMQEWFSNEEKPSQSVIGKVATGEMKVLKDGGDIDAITASTITSRAFMDALNRAFEAFVKAKALDASSPDTQQEQNNSIDIKTEEGGEIDE